MARSWFSRITPDILARAGAEVFSKHRLASLPHGTDWVQQPASASDFAVSRPAPSASPSQPMFVPMNQSADTEGVLTLRGVRFGR